MLKAEGKVYPKGNSLLIYIPSDIVTDSQFPLPTTKGSEVDIEIENDVLVMRRKKDR